MFPKHLAVAKIHKMTDLVRYSHDVQHRVVSHDFVRDVDTHVEASICVFDAGGVARPHL